MRPHKHATVSIGSGVVLGALLHSWPAGISCALMGTLVDVDHFFDFWLNRGFSLNPGEFLDFCYYGTSRKFFCIFHGYELIPLLAWVILLPAWRDVGLGLTLGYILHMISDQVFNAHLHRWTYFISYRFFHGFESRELVLFNPHI